MNKTVLMAAASILVLSASAALAGQASMAVTGAKALRPLVVSKSKTLYDQNSNTNGAAVDSQVFESSFAQYDSQGADDFTVPKGKTWTITEVDATGVYFNGSGPATSETVTFYTNDKTTKLPGKAVKKGSFNVKGTDNGGSFSIVLGKKGITLKAGTYWVSVQADLGGVGDGGEWGWSANTVQHGNPSAWQNYGGGFGICPTWGVTTSCLGTSVYGPDYAFDLKGSQKK